MFKYNKGLIIKKEWLDKIFDEGKVWEMRTTRTKNTGLIHIIESGTGMVVGEVEITGWHKISDEEKTSAIDKHLVNDSSLLTKWNFAWHLKNAKSYDKPIPYSHKPGAVIWVNL